MNTAQILVNGLTAGAVYSLLGVGLLLVLTNAKYLDFAQGGVFTLCSYIFVHFVFLFQRNFVLAGIVTVLVSILLGCSLFFGVYRPLERLEVGSNSMMIVSLGVYILVQNLVAIAWGNSLISVMGAHIEMPHRILGVVITRGQVGGLGFALLAFLLLLAMLYRSRFGLAVRAHSDNPELAVLCGVSPIHSKLMAFTVASSLAGAAGLVWALDTDLQPTMGFGPLVIGVATAISAGRGNLLGTVVLSIILGVSRNLAVVWVSAAWADGVTYCLLIVIIALRPHGIFADPPQIEFLERARP